MFAGDTPTTRAKRAHVLAATGNTEEAKRILEELLARRPREGVTAFEIAVIYGLLGDNDNAFTWLAQAEREHAVGFTFARVDPNLESLRSDPRFAVVDECQQQDRCAAGTTGPYRRFSCRELSTDPICSIEIRNRSVHHPHRPAPCLPDSNYSTIREAVLSTGTQPKEGLIVGM